MSTYLTFKIVLLGDGAVGKTSLRSKYMGEGFKGDYLLTIGVDFATKDIIRDGKTLKAQIWDLAGQERFKFLQEKFLKGTQGILFVYDVNRVESLESAIDWFYEVEKEVKKPIPVFILGNKIDTLPEDKRGHLPKELKLDAWGGKYTFPILNTSAKTGENVEQAFVSLINSILG
jgi:small GTP-binding protein